MSLLNELLQSENSAVVDFARDAQDLKNRYEENSITASEYKELLLDLEHSKTITAAAGDLETQTKLNGLISGLISVASIV
jgi:hypothetical protein